MQEHIKYNFVLWYQSLNKTKINKSNKIQKFNEFKQLKNSNPEIYHKPRTLIDFNQEHSISITLSQEQPRKYHNHLWCLPKIKHQKIQPKPRKSKTQNSQTKLELTNKHKNWELNQSRNHQRSSTKNHHLPFSPYKISKHKFSSVRNQAKELNYGRKHHRFLCHQRTKKNHLTL